MEKDITFYPKHNICIRKAFRGIVSQIVYFKFAVYSACVDITAPAGCRQYGGFGRARLE